MRAELINPFIGAAISVIETMTNIKVEPGKPALKANNQSFGEITGIIGLAGIGVSGNLVVSFEKNCILAIVNAMLGSEYTEITEDIVDAVGEITNMICGGTKRELNKLGVTIQMASPVIIRGQNIELSQLSQAPTLTIPFSTKSGTFCIDANLFTDGDRQLKSGSRPKIESAGDNPLLKGVSKI